MASILSATAKAAHSAATSILSPAQILPGATIPTTHTVKEDDPANGFVLDLSGKNIIVPGYIENYDKFKVKGVNNIYVVAVNDAFVTKARKEKLAPQGTPVHFIADDQGAFLSSLGLLFDATDLLGAPRAKRFVIVADNGKVTSIGVETDPTQITVSAADIILAHL